LTNRQGGLPPQPRRHERQLRRINLGVFFSLSLTQVNVPQAIPMVIPSGMFNGQPAWLLPLHGASASATRSAANPMKQEKNIHSATAASAEVASDRNRTQGTVRRAFQVDATLILSPL
jgi:hypothetical protein